jgi:hypothetical protein
LNIKDYYIRLFSFDRNQFKTFFIRYGVSNDDYNKIENILDEEIRWKPLFCWMLAIVIEKSSNREKILLKNGKNSLVVLYNLFIHKIVFGKPKTALRHEYQEWFKKSKDEKRALRLLAFLKNEYSSLSKDTAIKYLNIFNMTVPKSYDSLITTYFSVKLTEQGIEEIDFLHNSFQEYLLAEFYIESIANGKLYKIIGNKPSTNTYNFIAGLIEFILSQTDDDKNTDEVSDFIISLYEETNIQKNKVLQHLIDNSTKDIEQDVWKYDIPTIESGIWNLDINNRDLYKIWISKWICVFILAYINKHKKIIDTMLLNKISFIIKNSNIEYLSQVKLPGLDLNFANMTNANLSGAVLSHTSLSYAKLVDANLSDAKLTFSDLSRANLSRANLSNADLSSATIFHTTLSYADLLSTNLSGANLYSSDLS